ncbi:zinc finger MYM-type protein 1-like [Archocentrus centrarchus]|uniref:zinc finger MYM-type protein 1-like n=1 Tax=Archocentrus centrarchus TaxID=63155 RepID=UPI0011EA1DF0|nr:zinc finger MYM-type protein 1-like [Archocentrus centrarchus]
MRKLRRPTLVETAGFLWGRGLLPSPQRGPAEEDETPLEADKGGDFLGLNGSSKMQPTSDLQAWAKDTQAEPGPNSSGMQKMLKTLVEVQKTEGVQKTELKMELQLKTLKMMQAAQTANEVMQTDETTDEVMRALQAANEVADEVMRVPQAANQMIQVPQVVGQMMQVTQAADEVSQMIAQMQMLMMEKLQMSTQMQMEQMQARMLQMMAQMMQMTQTLIAESALDAQTGAVQALQVDETVDVATQCQLVLVLRYIDAKNTVQERFFEFIPLQSATADSIATALKERLATILPEDQKAKLICQAYDGASVMRGATAGVQKKIQDVYPNAHYIHCYAHQLNLIMQQATSHITKVRIFFSNLSGFSSFFSRSSKHTSVLDKVVAHRLPASSNVRWNFHSRAINTVFEHREDLIRCFQSIQDSGDFDPITVREAGAFAMLLEDQDFKFFLQLFHHIMPHVDLLYAKLQKKVIDSVCIQESIQQFQQDIQKIRNSLHSMVGQSSVGSSQPVKKRRTLSVEDHERIAAEVCDIILGHTRERFSFTNHLVSATLLQGDRFEQYNTAFPEDALSNTLKAYPVLNRDKLKTELTLIYSKEEFKACCGAVGLLQLFMENNLEEVFSETVTLLKIFITTPMTTAEAERCFSTLKRIKTFLRNSMTQDRLNALAMLSMEKRLVTEMTDFNKNVIEKFAGQKERRAKFMFI